MFFMPSMVVNGLLPWMSQSDFIEDRQECVDGDEPYTGFDQPTGQQTTLAEAIHPIAFANQGRFFGEVKRHPRLGAVHHPVSGLEVGIEQLRRFGRFEPSHVAFDGITHSPSAIDTNIRSATLVATNREP